MFRSRKDSSENDVLLTSKHVSLVSLFFVDIPLMTVRSVVWLRTPKTLALSPMLMKNICSSLYASTSLHRCRLLEKERDRLASSETAFKPVRESSSFRKQTMPQDLHSSEGPSDRTILPENTEPTPATRDQFHSDDDFATRKQMKSKQLQSLVNDVKSVRELPVVAFRASGILRKAAQLSLFPTRMSLATYLDSTFCLEYWQQFRVVVPYFLWLSVRITLVFLTFLKVDGLQDPLDWLSNPLPTDYIIAFSLVGATMLLTFFCWVGFCPMLDVVCLVLFAGVRLLSYWLTLTTFRDTHFFAIPGVSSDDINVEQLFFCFFALHDCMTLLMSLVPAHHGVLGKDFMYYSVIRTGMENALPSAPGFAELAGTQDIADEAGRVSTAAATLFINCRLGVAPSSIHSLIMGPNMIKSVRLNDLFATTAVWEIVMTFVLKLVTSILYLNVVHIVIFSLHVVGKLGYHVFASSVRSLALRRYEVKALFQEIVRRCSDRDDEIDGIGELLRELPPSTSEVYLAK
ncbi:MAG: uncharacterized protein KVP18_004361 [Porospora cf. gigantea A]|uniref:uncharacterized protein n=1 Tax=Porospora cf. gigantea A TaxID=2853593 RepID=UPI0035598515|nr:MAG: hypothetical protein KVP18_004361 [Porospora cf. gigantea A]